MTETIVDGSKRINGTDTSKRGYPIVENGTPVDCPHCSEVHEANFRDSDVGLDVPAGHKRHSHYVCPHTDYSFAAKKGSKLR